MRSRLSSVIGQVDTDAVSRATCCDWRAPVVAAGHGGMKAEGKEEALLCHQCLPVQQVFRFGHPWNPLPAVVADQEATLTFDAPCPHGAVFHGFAGYFRAVLFGDVTLSSCPEDRTPRLQEWLPVFFPTVEPFQCPVTLVMHRKRSEDRVWYEWHVTAVADEGEGLPAHGERGGGGGSAASGSTADPPAVCAPLTMAPAGPAGPARTTSYNVNGDNCSMRTQTYDPVAANAALLTGVPPASPGDSA